MFDPILHYLQAPPPKKAIRSSEKRKLSNNELIIALKNKESVGYTALYDMYSAALYGVILKIIPETDVAEDILSETFMKIASSFDQYDSSKGRLFTWMMNITRNQCLDRLRTKDYKKSKKNRSIEEVALIENSYNTSFNPDLLDIKNLIKCLDPQEKQLIDLAYFQGYSRQEMAEELQLPVGTVKTRLRNAISTLRSIFTYNRIAHS